MDIIKRLGNYKRLKAEIKDIELDIEELHDVENLGPKGITYEEKAAPTNKFNSDTENEAIRIADKTKRLEFEKRVKEREIERIDNALSILDDKEREVLNLKHINGFRWDTITYKLDKSYSHCKRIEEESLQKIKEFIR